eukprot:4086116-Amphidinium_carterae.1
MGGVPSLILPGLWLGGQEHNQREDLQPWFMAERLYQPTKRVLEGCKRNTSSIHYFLLPIVEGCFAIEDCVAKYCEHCRLELGTV